jgi:hypothetical protein
VANGQGIDIAVLGNDSDDGLLDAGSVTVVQAAAHGATAVNPASGAITYTHDGSATSSDSFSYRVNDNDGLSSNVATVTVTISGGGSSTLLTAGLVTHLETDSGVTLTAANQVSGWSDQSARGNHLTAAGDPRLLGGALNGHAVIDFDGDGDKLERLTAISGLPAGGANRTVYLVANYRSTGFGGFVYGRGACNQAFGTVVSAGGKLMVQGSGTVPGPSWRSAPAERRSASSPSTP